MSRKGGKLGHTRQIFNLERSLLRQQGWRKDNTKLFSEETYICRQRFCGKVEGRDFNIVSPASHVIAPGISAEPDFDGRMKLLKAMKARDEPAHGKGA